MRDTITCHQRQSAHLLEEGLLMRDTITCNQRPSAHLLDKAHGELVKPATSQLEIAQLDGGVAELVVSILAEQWGGRVPHLPRRGRCNQRSSRTA